MDDTKKKKTAKNGIRHQKMTEAVILDNLKKISATISKMELQRQMFGFVPISQILAKRKEFLKWQRAYYKFLKIK